MKNGNSTLIADARSLAEKVITKHYGQKASRKLIESTAKRIAESMPAKTSADKN